RGGFALAPDLGYPMEPPFWRRHAVRAAAAVHSVDPREPLFLVGHSGAGALLPAIREHSGRAVAGYVFVDAGLPDDSQPRKGNGAFAVRLAELHAHGRRFPEWTDADLRDVVPDPVRRRAL